jgi:hypothetical protein
LEARPLIVNASQAKSEDLEISFFSESALFSFVVVA